MPDAVLIRVTGMVQRNTQAPPLRLTLPVGHQRPAFTFRFEPFTFGLLAFAAAALGPFLFALTLLVLPFAAPAFFG
jgi:hypothetical protein